MRLGPSAGKKKSTGRQSCWGEERRREGRGLEMLKYFREKIPLFHKEIGQRLGADKVLLLVNFNGKGPLQYLDSNFFWKLADHPVRVDGVQEYASGP